MRMRRLVVGLSFLALGLAAPAAHGGPPDKDKKAAQIAAEKKAGARALADHAKELFDAGKYEQALEEFSRAEQLYHAPTLLWGMARSSFKTGRLLEARALFQRLIAEKLEKNAPVEFRDAQEAAKEELATLEPRIPTFQISVRGAAGRPLSLKIDGAPSPAEIGKAVEIDPGTHTFEVIAKGGPSAAKTVDIKESAHERVDLDLTPAPVVTATVAPPPPPPKRPSAAPGVILLGLGAIGVGVGAYTGVETINRTNAIKVHCQGTRCSPSDAPAADTARTFGLVSTVAFAVAGASVVGGVTLLAIRARSKPKAATTGGSFNIVVGPGTLGATGAF